MCTANAMSIFLALARFIVAVTAAGFSFPDTEGDLVFASDTDVTVQWATSLPNYMVFLCQQPLWTNDAHESTFDHIIYDTVESGSKKGPLIWNVSASNLEETDAPPKYFLWLAKNRGDVFGASDFRSELFNISSPPISTLSRDVSVLTTSTPHPSSSTLISITTEMTNEATSTITTSAIMVTAFINPTSSPPSTDNNSDDNKQSEKAALGIGLGLGIPMLLFVAAGVVFIIVCVRTVRDVGYVKDTKERSKGLTSPITRHVLDRPLPPLPHVAELARAHSRRISELWTP
ncbi:hypothetical protein BDV96DRAFT_115162 [Lophiotrema nucula]|uniref:Mid2 domain-containing protein n=1 Tax=Lophiotrema nucula TaxID=690887 RepID=A0A6A5Z2E6_9PLEO|nr:hypothetical protein BDV96DRAFT_115162 [Lophiotrema nucula]